MLECYNFMSQPVLVYGSENYEINTADEGTRESQSDISETFFWAYFQRLSKKTLDNSYTRIT
jgi:hypothetical protein